MDFDVFKSEPKQFNLVINLVSRIAKFMIPLCVRMYANVYIFLKALTF